MKAGFHSMYLEERPLVDAIERVAKAGYDAIELNAERLPWAEPHIGPLAPDVDPAEVAEAAARAGLAVSAVGAHCEMLAMSTHEALNYARGCIDIARITGAPIVHVLSGQRPPDMGEAEAFRRCGEYAEAVIDAGGQAGVGIAWEAVVGMEIDGSDALSRLLDAVGDDLGVNFDPSHLQLVDGDAVAAARVLGPRVVHLHIKDACGAFPSHAFPPLGQGIIDLGGVIRELAGAGYDGTASVEWEAHAVGSGFGRDDQLALEGSRRFMRERLGI